MKIARRSQVYYEHSRFNEPNITVKSGEIFQAETELNTGEWLTSAEDKWTPAKSGGPNPTVCVKVDGAQPGQVLKVSIEDIELQEFGYTGFQGEDHPLASLIYNQDWGLNTRTVKIDQNYIYWDEETKIPVEPMIGTIGVAPESEVLKNTKGGTHGGNMDINEVTIGSSVYLPIQVKGALLHLGDVHACQGDGEINGAGGIECRSLLTLKTEVLPRPESMELVRIKNEDYIMTAACFRSVEESFYAAARELLLWMTSEFDFSEEEAYLLMGEVMKARSTQFVNPTRTYICKMPRCYL